MKAPLQSGQLSSQRVAIERSSTHLPQQSQASICYSLKSLAGIGEVPEFLEPHPVVTTTGVVLPAVTGAVQDFKSLPT